MSTLPNNRNLPEEWEHTDLCRLARAARQAVRDGMDGPLALSYVLWPSVAVEDALEAAA